MDLNWLIRGFHDDCVMMSSTDTDRITMLRDTIKERIERRLDQAGRPAIHRWIRQGSHAMHTMIRDLATGKPDMDLDIGVVFRYEDLITRLKTEYPPLVVKRWIAEALDHGNQNESPQIRKNCTTVRYRSGEQIDVPIYRISRLYRGDEYMELASTGWILSDPAGVNDWFTEKCQLSPETSGSLQLRRIVRLFKALGRSQTPQLSGFAVTALVAKNYVPRDGRDDYSFYLTGQRIMESLTKSAQIEHPVLLGRTITKGVADAAVVTYRNRLRAKLGALGSAFSTGNDEGAAVRAWRQVFYNHNYFREAYWYAD